MPRNLEPMLATPAHEPPDGRELGLRDQVGRGPGAGLRRRPASCGSAPAAASGRDAALSGARRDRARRWTDARRSSTARSSPSTKTGVPSFQLLQRRMGLSNRGDDPPRVDEMPGHLRRLRPALARRRARCSPSPTSAGASCSPSSGFDGPTLAGAPPPRRRRRSALLDAVHARGLEGIVAKRLGSPYRPGQRSREWLKVRDRRGQELVIGGWMPGEGSRGGRVGSLLVGYWDATPRRRSARREQQLVYAGGVGTGFTQEMLTRADRAARSRSARRVAVRARRGPAGQVRPARPRPRRRAGLGRARARLRGRVHRVDARGHAAPAVVQGPARRQGPARGRARDDDSAAQVFGSRPDRCRKDPAASLGY